ncbi:unnamed protein product [Schistosoma margrebowiei]|uniref:Uncharacterized protein n=1 Tax=Schistosoma margrebowiei TaxID=48269 RepID=A0A183N2R1_9TREM|nr:unnamed protein product [Schistosoma margrebowiei]
MLSGPAALPLLICLMASSRGAIVILSECWLSKISCSDIFRMSSSMEPYVSQQLMKAEGCLIWHAGSNYADPSIVNEA